MAIAVGAALWLGILTSLGPCTITTNVLALAFLTRDATHPWRVLRSAFAYAVGTVVGYAGLAALVVRGALAMPVASSTLQRVMNQALGPTLILVGVIVLGLVRFRPRDSRTSALAVRFATQGDTAGAFSLGLLFAVTFCPLSAAIFFGSLIPLALREGSSELMASFYGLGCGLPVLLFTALATLGIHKLARAHEALTRCGRWVRLTSGTLFVVVGVHLCLSTIFEVY